MVDRIEQGWSVARAAEAFGVSRRTVGKWLPGIGGGGERRFHDRSSAPRRYPRRIPAGVVDQIQALRRQRMTGPAIAGALGVARSTVGLVLRRLGLGKLSALDPKVPIVRYERAAPGEMIHLDIKKLGKFNVQGHRVTGDRQAGRSRKAGWDLLHVCVDDASRLAYTEVLPPKASTTRPPSSSAPSPGLPATASSSSG